MATHRAIKPVVLALGLAAAPVGLVLAQNEQTPLPETEDASFLERQIQNLLGGEGRTVRVSGLNGLLSSQATISLIEISDDDGVWLTVRDVALDWRRLALVRGRLQVNALTVGTVNMVRAPLPSPAPPPKIAADPDATPQLFALPDLPVAVDVREFSIGGVRLGTELVGQQVDLSVNGNARLEDGEGNVDLSVVRIDGHDTTFGLTAGFENETRRLLVDLDLQEADDGLVTELAGIPGTPPLSLTLKGDAPISDFQADLALRTDGEDRLSGTIGLAEIAVEGALPDQLITADVSGDVADLFLPDYRDFFGHSVSVRLAARQGAEIGLDIETLEVDTQGMQLSGRIDLTPQFLPSVVDVTAHVGMLSGLPVVMPLPGPALLVGNADMTLSYDESTGDTFNLDLTGNGVQRTDGLLIDQIALQATGQLTKPDPATISGVTARISGGMTGFSSTDPALWDAVGDDVDLDAEITWAQDGPLDLHSFQVVAGDIAAQGTAQVTGLEAGAPQVDSQFSARVADLDRFSGITGQVLGGAIDADLSAQFDTVTGAGAVDLTGQTRDLTLGPVQADGLLTGPVDLALRAARQEDGITVETLALNGERIAMNGTASIAPDYWPREVDLRGRIGNPLGGPVSLPLPGAPADLQSADLILTYDAETGDAFLLKVDAQDFIQEGQLAVDHLVLGAEGTLDRTDGAVKGASMTVSGDLGGINAANPDLAEVLADGARLSGSLDWVADDGTLNIPGFHMVSGDLHSDLTAAITDLGDDDMAGSASFDLTTGSLSRFSSIAGRELGGEVDAKGSGNFTMANGFFDVNAVINGRDLATGQADLDKLLSGTPRIVAKAERDEDGLRIQDVLVETDELNLIADGTMVDDVIALSLDGGLRDLGVFVDGFSGPLTLDVDARNESEIWSVDGTVEGPGGARADVSGDALRPDGTMNLSANGALPLALANAFIVPRSITGDMNFDLRVEGEPGLDAVSGTVQIAGARAADPATRLALEDIGLNLRLANSRADIDLGGNLSSGGRITVVGPVDLTGNLPADITATLTSIHLVDPTLYDINLDGQIAMQGPLAGGAAISGRIDIGRSELKIPAGTGGAGAIPDIVHSYESEQSLVARTRAGLVKAPTTSGSGGGGVAYPLDIIISAPQQIFVRGRGLDVELGGEIAIGGTTAAPIPSGSLKLIRGRLALLAQRLEFETAEISLQGDLEPDIYMVASSDNGDIVAKIVIEGPATDPEINFTSDPELPEDEVLAQLFFGKPLQDLTPLELAQLASAINTLSGGGGGLFGRLREGLGVDDLSVATDEEGTTSVSAGKYLTERVYTDVTFGSDGTSEVQLNYEIKKDFTARGRFDNQGDTGIGIHFERDY